MVIFNLKIKYAHKSLKDLLHTSQTFLSEAHVLWYVQKQKPYWNYFWDTRLDWNDSWLDPRTMIDPSGLLQNNKKQIIP
jgi:hypothetical protein